MRLLLDMNLSPRWVAFLARSGFEVVHWTAIGSTNATDAETPPTDPHKWTRDTPAVISSTSVRKAFAAKALRSQISTDVDIHAALSERGNEVLDGHTSLPFSNPSFCSAFSAWAPETRGSLDMLRH